MSVAVTLTEYVPVGAACPASVLPFHVIASGPAGAAPSASVRTVVPVESWTTAVTFCAGLASVTLAVVAKLPFHCMPVFETVTVLPTKDDAFEFDMF